MTKQGDSMDQLLAMTGGQLGGLGILIVAVAMVIRSFMSYVIEFSKGANATNEKHLINMNDRIIHLEQQNEKLNELVLTLTKQNEKLLAEVKSLKNELKNK